MSMTTSVDSYVRTLGINSNWSIVSPKNKAYGDGVIKNSGFGYDSVVAFGQLGDDTATVDIDGTSYPVVASPVEYCFTDMVFVKQQYTQPLKDILRAYAEFPGKREKYQDAYNLILEIAKQREIPIDEVKVRSEYNTAIENEIKTIGLAELRKVDIGGIKLSDEQIINILQGIITYYKNPSAENFQILVNIGAVLGDKANRNGAFEKLWHSYNILIETLSGADFATNWGGKVALKINSGIENSQEQQKKYLGSILQISYNK